MKNNAISKGVLYWVKFVRDVIIWVVFNTVVAVFPLFAEWLVSVIIENPIGLNDITPDFMLIAFSLSCTVLFCIYKSNEKDGVEKALLFITFFYAASCIVLYCAFYAKNNIDFLTRSISTNQNIIFTIIIIMLVSLMIVLLFGAIVETRNKHKKQENSQSISN